MNLFIYWNELLRFFLKTKAAWSPITLWVSPNDNIDGHVLADVSDSNSSVLNNNAEFNCWPIVTVLFKEPILIPNIL